MYIYKVYIGVDYHTKLFLHFPYVSYVFEMRDGLTTNVTGTFGGAAGSTARNSEVSSGRKWWITVEGSEIR